MIIWKVYVLPGIIPAHAGNTRLLPVNICRPQDHPCITMEVRYMKTIAADSLFFGTVISLAIAVAGLLTVFGASLFANLM